MTSSMCDVTNNRPLRIVSMSLSKELGLSKGHAAELEDAHTWSWTKHSFLPIRVDW